MRAEDSDGFARGGAEGLIVAPFAAQSYRADGEHDEGKRNEQNPQADVWAGCVPVDDALGGVRRFVLLGLEAAGEQRRHKQNCGENEEQFQGGEGTLNRLHGFTLYHKVNYVYN